MKKKIFILLISVFILNLIWEFLHFPLYICNLTISNNSLMILKVSLGDLLIISLIFFFVSLKNKSIRWLNSPSKFDYLVITFLGIVAAIFIELNALSIGRWSYKEVMPTIFGIGFTPLIQLAATSLIALWFVNLINPSKQH